MPGLKSNHVIKKDLENSTFVSERWHDEFNFKSDRSYWLIHADNQYDWEDMNWKNGCQAMTSISVSNDKLWPGTLTFDLWPWPLVWISLLSMVITPDNFMTIRREEHDQKVWKTDGRMDRTVHTADLTQLKYVAEKSHLWLISHIRWGRLWLLQNFRSSWMFWLCEASASCQWWNFNSLAAFSRLWVLT